MSKREGEKKKRQCTFEKKKNRGHLNRGAGGFWRGEKGKTRLEGDTSPSNCKKRGDGDLAPKKGKEGGGASRERSLKNGGFCGGKKEPRPPQSKERKEAPMLLCEKKRGRRKKGKEGP